MSMIFMSWAIFLINIYYLNIQTGCVSLDFNNYKHIALYDQKIKFSASNVNFNDTYGAKIYNP